MTDAYAIAIISDPLLEEEVEKNKSTKGYLVGEQGQVQLYKTEAEAQRELRKLLRNPGYSWKGCRATVEKVRREK